MSQAKSVRKLRRQQGRLGRRWWALFVFSILLVGGGLWLLFQGVQSLRDLAVIVGTIFLLEGFSLILATSDREGWEGMPLVGVLIIVAAIPAYIWGDGESSRIALLLAVVLGLRALLDILLALPALSDTSSLGFKFPWPWGLLLITGLITFSLSVWAVIARRGPLTTLVVIVGLQACARGLAMFSGAVRLRRMTEG
jgi:uncharacterized membrane protein HdeD (DUF308 family)